MLSYVTWQPKSHNTLHDQQQKYHWQNNQWQKDQRQNESVIKCMLMHVNSLGCCCTHLCKFGPLGVNLHQQQNLQWARSVVAG